MKEKLMNNLINGAIFSIIPFVFLIIATKVGIDNFFKLVFVLELGLVFFLAQGTLIEKLKVGR